MLTHVARKWRNFLCIIDSPRPALRFCGSYDGAPVPTPYTCFHYWFDYSQAPFRGKVGIVYNFFGLLTLQKAFELKRILCLHSEGCQLGEYRAAPCQRCCLPSIYLSLASSRPSWVWLSLSRRLSLCPLQMPLCSCIWRRDCANIDVHSDIQ